MADADVLLRNVDYAVRHEWLPALLAAIHPNAPTGVALFATTMAVYLPRDTVQ